MRRLQDRRKSSDNPALSDHQNQVQVDDTDDPMDKMATEALPATQLKIDYNRFRLREIRIQQLSERQTKTTQYQIVWGKHSNRFNTSVNEGEVQISMSQLPFERSSQNLVTQVKRDAIRVH